MDDGEDVHFGRGHPRPDSDGGEAEGEAAELGVGTDCSGAAPDGGERRGNGGGEESSGKRRW